jgi:hypothetical protein
MDGTMDLGLVSGQFDESNVTVDADLNVVGMLTLAGVVDEEWVAAFEAAAPSGAAWSLDDAPAIRFGPIPVGEFPDQVASLRLQIAAANRSVEEERHKRATAAYIEAQERARAYQQAIDALSGAFGRRLGPLGEGERQAA